MVSVRLFGPKLVIEALAYILVGVFYADKLGLVDVTGRLRDRVSGQATPGGGQA